MNGNYEKFRRLLEDLFQLDHADLDFGIYRIMNQKRDEIMRFLDDDLLPQVQEAFQEYQGGDRANIETQLNETIQQIKSYGMDPEASPKVQELREQLSEAVDVTKLENEVFSDLYDFLRRYYYEGDFLSLRRYKEGVYAIPYEGEEVKLHWANHDQYYVKTSEYFRDYTFRLPSGKRAHFKLMEADTEKDNQKAETGKERRFILYEEDPLVEVDGDLHIRFEYRLHTDKAKQDTLNSVAFETIINTSGFSGWKVGLAQPMPTESNPNRTLLEKHLNDYTARNTFDYFIHKDLGGFLRRELDFYIKNEVMHLGDIENESAPRVEQYLSKIKVIRRIAHKIIKFLAQIEDFQKKLWLKRKFVTQTNYCVTIDLIPNELWSEILQNESQIKEWKDFFSLNELLEQDGLFNRGLTKDFLNRHQTLVLDTSNFSEDFKLRLLSSFDDLDDDIDGILIKSDNFHALELLLSKCLKSVKCIYIDPPYNTGVDDFIYKDNYQSSSWLTMMENRLQLAEKYLANNGVIFASIDDNESASLKSLLASIYGEEKYLSTLFIQVRYPEKTLTEDMKFHKLIEQIHTYSSMKSGVYREKQEYDISKFSWYVHEVASPKEILDLGGKKVEVFTKGDYDIISGEPSEEGLKEIWASGKVLDGNSSGRFFRDYLAGRERLDGYGTLYKVYGIGNDMFDHRYFTGPKRTGATKGKYYQGIPVERLEDSDQLQELAIPNYFDFAASFGNCRHEGGVELRSGKKPEVLIEKILSIATHDGDIVLDFFLGSGTASAVAQKMGRKWIGIEMGESFEQKAKLRMKNVLNGEQTGVSQSSDWKGSGFFKYLHLEQYEDTLGNLELKRTEEQDSLLAGSDTFRESYILSYMLDVESNGSPSLLNVDAFVDPFNYKLKIATGRAGETRPVVVDLVETFNYLLGLTVRHIDHIRGFRAVQGMSPEGEKVLVIWRNLKEKSNEDLEEFFRKQEYNPRDMEFDLIYVNGDNNLENIRRPDETWKVRLIEEDFKRLMFDVEDI